MAAKVKVTINHAGIGAMLKSGEFASDMLSRAERVAAAARSSAPVDTGAYRDSITAYLATTDRAVGRAGSSVDYAMQVEAAHGTMAQALDAAG